MLNFRVFTMVIIVLLVVSLINSEAIYAENDKESLVMKMKPITDTIISGGPCVLKFTFTNTEASKVTLDLELYGCRTEGFYFEMINEKNEQVAKNFDILGEGGIGIGREIEIYPGKSTELKLILNQWCSTLLPQGKYKVISYYESFRSWSRRKRRDDKEFKPITSTPRSECQIEILPSNKQNQKKLQEIFSDLLDKAITDTDEKPIPPDEQMFAAEQLAYSTSPLVVPYLAKLLSSDTFFSTTLSMEIIEGFRRVGTVEAAEELVKIIKGKTPPNLSEESFKEKVVLEIFRLSDISKDPEVIKICTEVTTTMPRPKEKQTVD